VPAWGSADRLLEGVPLSLAALAALSDSARARALDELAGAIDALRGFPADRARAAGVEPRPHEGFGHPRQRELHRRHAAELGSEAVARVEALWRGYETGPHHQHTVPYALAHADLKPEHILHDPTSGQITAVLDWGDACLSQAGFDLAVIGLFFDACVRDELADRLPNVNAQQVAHDAELLVAVRWLCDLDVGAAGGDEPSFHAMCVEGLRAHLDPLA
jgi:aminoglycoside phosphotransferase (APT) family kinase protein